MDQRLGEISNTGRSASTAQPQVDPNSRALSNILRDSRDELEGLLKKSQQIQEESSRALRSFMEVLHSKVSDELEGASTNFASEMRRRAQYEASTVLDVLEVEASARLSARLDEALAKLQAVQGQLESNLKEKTDECKRTLAEVSINSLQALEGKGQRMLDDFRTELQSTVETLRLKEVNDASDHLREGTNRLADQLQAKADQAFETMHRQLKASGKALVDETEKQILTCSQSALEGLRKHALEIVNRETSEFLLHDLRKRLDRVASAIEQVDMGPTNRESTAGKTD